MLLLLLTMPLHGGCPLLIRAFEQHRHAWRTQERRFPGVAAPMHAAGSLGVTGVGCRWQTARFCSRHCCGAASVEQGCGLDAAQAAAGPEERRLVWALQRREQPKRVVSHLQQEVASQAAEVQLGLQWGPGSGDAGMGTLTGSEMKSMQ